MKSFENALGLTVYLAMLVQSIFPRGVVLAVRQAFDRFQHHKEDLRSVQSKHADTLIGMDTCHL